MAGQWGGLRRQHGILNPFRKITGVKDDQYTELSTLLGDVTIGSSDSSSTESLASLPLELIDKIFGQILADELEVSAVSGGLKKKGPTIFACSLVSKEWRDLTLRHRFRLLRVWISPPDRSLLCDEHYPGLPLATSIDELLEFLRSHPHVSNAVHTLEFQRDRYEAYPDPIDYIQVLPLLPRLHTLELWGCSIWGELDEQPVLQSLEHLAINESDFKAGCLSRVLNMFN